MTEQQFLRQIKRLLHCKADKKREILRQLESDIASAKEVGSLPFIMISSIILAVSTPSFA